VYMSHGSTVGMGRTIGVQFPAGAMMGFLSPLHRVQTGSGSHPASDPMDTGGSYPEVKAAGACS